MSDTVLYEELGSIAVITLNNPARHNALGKLELSTISSCLDQVDQDAMRALIIKGEGDSTFCAGASLVELNAGEIRGEDFQAMTDRIDALPIPTIAALGGNVFGGGVELSMSCDFRIAREGVRMRVPAAAIGLCYPVSGIQRFVDKLGPSTARRILLAAETLQSEEMLRLGIVDQLVGAADLESRVMEYANSLSALAPLAVRAMKQLIKSAVRHEIDPVQAAALSRLCSESDDLKEGFAAQREKRPPVFSGR